LTIRWTVLDGYECVTLAIADLEGLPEILPSHVAEAIQYRSYRSLDRRLI